MCPSLRLYVSVTVPVSVALRAPLASRLSLSLSLSLFLSLFLSRSECAAWAAGAGGGCRSCHHAAQVPGSGIVAGIRPTHAHRKRGVRLWAARHEQPAKCGPVIAGCRRGRRRIRRGMSRLWSTTGSCAAARLRSPQIRRRSSRWRSRAGSEAASRKSAPCRVGGGLRHACARWGRRRVRLVRGEGRGVSD